MAHLMPPSRTYLESSCPVIRSANTTSGDGDKCLLILQYIIDKVHIVYTFFLCLISSLIKHGLEPSLESHPKPIEV